MSTFLRIATWKDRGDLGSTVETFKDQPEDMKLIDFVNKQMKEEWGDRDFNLTTDLEEDSYEIGDGVVTIENNECYTIIFHKLS